MRRRTSAGARKRVARRHRPYGTDQLIAWRVLEEESAGSGLQSLVDVLVEVEGREDEDARRIAVPSCIEV
jgi:hypothetical protein